jgi:hypothetical protein
MRGAPLKAVQDLLGHATITLTMLYAHLAPEVAREAVQLLDLQTGTSVATPRLPSPARSASRPLRRRPVGGAAGR